MIKLTKTKLNKLINGMGNSKRLSDSEWMFNSIAGELYIKFIDNDFIHMQFQDVKLANEIVRHKSRLNPFTGKFNFHWLKKTECDYKIAELCSYLTNLIGEIK